MNKILKRILNLLGRKAVKLFIVDILEDQVKKTDNKIDDKIVEEIKKLI